MLPKWIENQPQKLKEMAGALWRVSMGISKCRLQVDVWDYRGAKKGKTLSAEESFLKSSCGPTGVADSTLIPAPTTVLLGLLWRGLQQSHSRKPVKTSRWIHPGTLCGWLAWHWSIPGLEVKQSLKTCRLLSLKPAISKWPWTGVAPFQNLSLRSRQLRTSCPSVKPQWGPWQPEQRAAQPARVDPAEAGLPPSPGHLEQPTVIVVDI